MEEDEEDENEENEENEDEILDPEEIRQLMLDLDPNDPQRIWFFREDGPNGPDPVNLRQLHQEDERNNATIHINRLKTTQPQSVEEEPVYDFTNPKNNNDRDPPESGSMIAAEGGRFRSIKNKSKKNRKGKKRTHRKKTKKSRKSTSKKNKRYTKRK